MRHKLALTTPILAAVMLLAVAVPALAAVNWQITLKHTAAFPRATGQAQYQSQPGQRELQIEAEHLRALGRQARASSTPRARSSAAPSSPAAASPRSTATPNSARPSPRSSTDRTSPSAPPAGAVILRGTF